MSAVPPSCNPAARQQPDTLVKAAAQAGTGADAEGNEQGAAAGEVARAAVVTSCRKSFVTLPRVRTGDGASNTIALTLTLSIILPFPLITRDSHVVPLNISLGPGHTHASCQRLSVIGHTCRGRRLMKWRRVISPLKGNLRPPPPEIPSQITSAITQPTVQHVSNQITSWPGGVASKDVAQRRTSLITPGGVHCVRVTVTVQEAGETDVDGCRAAPAIKHRRAPHIVIGIAPFLIIAASISTANGVIIGASNVIGVAITSITFSAASVMTDRITPTNGIRNPIAIISTQVITTTAAASIITIMAATTGITASIKVPISSSANCLTGWPAW